MKNTIENKAKLFAQYWGQKVLVWPTSENGINQKVGVTYMSKYGIKNRTLELTPLRLISDEELIVCYHLYCSFIAYDYTMDWKPIAEMGRNWFYNSGREKIQNYSLLCDHLRSIGYALPFNGLSVEEQVSFGWVVLKTKI